MANLAKLARIYPGQVNPDLTEKSGTPIARPGNIIDNSLSIYGKALSNALGPDIFEGVSTFRGIVLTPKFEIPDAVNIISDTDQSEKTEFVKVMIPELHLEKPNPFGARNLAEYMDLVNTHYQPYTLLDKVSDGDVKVGSLVHVTFQDANKTVGRVTFIENNTGFSEFNASTFSESSRSSSAASGNLNNSQHLSSEGFPPSTRTTPATAQDLMNAFPALALNPDLALAIEQAAKDMAPPAGPMDPAHLANLINFETNGSFSAGIQSPTDTRATGLIQFTEGTARELGTSLEELKGMSEVEQMQYVKDYFELFRVNGGKQLSTQQDVAMAVFYPNAVGQGADYSIYEDIKNKRGVANAEQARSNNRGIETAGDYYNKAKSRFILEV